MCQTSARAKEIIKKKSGSALVTLRFWGNVGREGVGGGDTGTVSYSIMCLILQEEEKLFSGTSP